MTPRSTVGPCELLLEDGFDEQAASIAASAIAIKRRPYKVYFLLGNMIDARSIIVIRACRGASVAVICRVDASLAANYVTILPPYGAQKRQFLAALSAILLNKVKKLEAISCSLREFYY